MNDKKIYYLSQNYEIVLKKISPEEGGGYFAYYKDFKGVMGDGEDIQAAMDDAQSAFAAYLDVALANNQEIKAPSHLGKSKRINITIPLHILYKIDDYVKKHDTNRSSFFKKSALQVIDV
jgi:predicted RNase H-like HicB family nuclease